LLAVVIRVVCIGVPSLATSFGGKPRNPLLQGQEGIRGRIGE
jgi:hypothetical protein